MCGNMEIIEQSLEVGKAVVFHAEPSRAQGARFKTFIRGWQRGGYILLEVPATDGPTPLLCEGSPCILRFLGDGNVYGVSTSIINIGAGSFGSYLRVSWPHEVSLVRIRQKERVKTHVPVKITSPGNSVITEEICSIRVGTSKTMSLVRPSCLRSPLR